MEHAEPDAGPTRTTTFTPDPSISPLRLCYSSHWAAPSSETRFSLPSFGHATPSVGAKVEATEVESAGGSVANGICRRKCRQWNVQVEVSPMESAGGSISSGACNAGQWRRETPSSLPPVPGSSARPVLSLLLSVAAFSSFHRSLSATGDACLPLSLPLSLSRPPCLGRQARRHVRKRSPRGRPEKDSTWGCLGRVSKA